MSRRLSHVELQGLPPALTGEELNKEFFPFTLQSIRITRWHPHIVRALPLVWVLRQLSHLPSLRTLTIEHHVFSMFMLRVDEQSAAAALPVLPSIHTLKLVGYYARGVVHPKFVPKLAQSLPNLATLHLDCTALPGGSPEYTVDHLVLTNIPWWLKQDLTPWKVRRLTYVLGPDRGRSCFSLAHGRVDLSTALCLSITQPVIAAQIWDDMVEHAGDVRLFELESSVTSFSELVAPLIERRHCPTESLARVPLTCISISTRELGIPWDSDGSWEQARNEFLRGASSCFPSLRYVAVATPHRPARIAPAPAYPGDDIPVWTWWRVHRDSSDSVVEIKEIPVWEGRRVRKFLRDANARAMRDFGGRSRRVAGGGSARPAGDIDK
ncbi:hypothetical protein GSI_01381 [Ganoderma sinense ZZ0214-1]|uniref:Uncharacterized protein n=1 Tax=Ganoderma sinense ZZ0214-1 TaxID=1077348 RepID=A0A2G8SV85_9APHY|nr:hypothetical protein GSI_01381 [Ganoderma sinense ZZ0214-1]